MTEQKDITEAPVLRTINPLVFISHDTRDAELAEAFSNLLKSVSAGVLKSFRTSDRRGNQGIEYGIEWYPEIIKNIQSASDVVCLLTERSVNRPWILFEAGMAKGKLDTPILGVALGLDLKNASTGPFAQFQNCGDDEDSLTKLVFQLVDRIPGSEPDRDTIAFQVGKFKQNIDPILAKLSSGNQATPKRKNLDEIENSSAKLFEEIKIMFQDLPSRIDRGEASRSKKRRRRFHPEMLEELLFRSNNPMLGIRAGLSLFRESAPWIYDEANLLLAKFQSSKTASSREKVMMDIESLLMISTHSSFFDKYVIDSEEEYIVFREVPRMILHALSRLVESNLQ